MPVPQFCGPFGAHKSHNHHFVKAQTRYVPLSRIALLCLLPVSCWSASSGSLVGFGSLVGRPAGDVWVRGYGLRSVVAVGRRFDGSSVRFRTWVGMGGLMLGCPDLRVAVSSSAEDGLRWPSAKLPWGVVVVGLSSGSDRRRIGLDLFVGPFRWVGSDVGGNWWIVVGVPRPAGDGGGDGDGPVGPRPGSVGRQYFCRGGWNLVSTWSVGRMFGQIRWQLFSVCIPSIYSLIHSPPFSFFTFHLRL